MGNVNISNNRLHTSATIIIQSYLINKKLNRIQDTFLQAAGAKILCISEDINIFPIYFPPRYKIKCEQYEQYSTQLEHHFIVDGNFNAKYS